MGSRSQSLALLSRAIEIHVKASGALQEAFIAAREEGERFEQRVLEAQASAFRGSRSDLPDGLTTLARRLIQIRSARHEAFDNPDLFADPAWDMLLHLYTRAAAGRQTLVTSLCDASGVPASTALRWIGVLVEQGLATRHPHEDDRRKVCVEITPKACAAVEKTLIATADALALSSVKPPQEARANGYGR